ncbi:MAG: Ig-like domain-containing protein, partial [Acidobacteria bacterium]|nr:Ig-like domain-containing protein [Acidobacteriota bacterium]
DVELPLSETVGRRVTLSYTPAEVEDHRTVNAYGGLYAVPVYLVRLRPQLKVAGRPVDVGDGALDMGIPHRIEVVLTGPWGTQTVSQTVLSGSYHALALGAQKTLRPDESVEDPGDTERLGARLLTQIAHGYGEDWEQGEKELAGLYDVELLRPLPSVAVASLALEVEQLLGLPYGVDFQGVTLDAALRVAEPLSHTGDAATSRSWMRLSALHGSALEQQIFADEFRVEGISADKGLGLARDLGVEVLRLTSSNLPAELPTLAHPQVVKDDIANWVRLGLTVEVPRSQVTLNAWTGSVWRAEEASTGSSGYFIAGSLAGGSTSEPPSNWILDFLAQALASPYSAEPNTDPLSAVEIVKIPAGDGQDGEVGEEFGNSLGVVARDRDGRPVVGAPVNFIILQGGGTLIDPEGLEGDNLVVPTNELGIAEVTLRSGEQTSANPWYVLQNPGDRYSTQALMNFVDVVAASDSGTLAVREPFSALAFPGEPASLRRTNPAGAGGSAGAWADSVVVSVEDSFGNPISNQQVTFSVGSPTQHCSPPADNFQNGAVFNNQLAEGGGFEDCGVRSPLLGECGGPSLNQETSRLGTSAGLILGNSNDTTYRFNVSSSGLPGLDLYLDAFGSCNAGAAVRATTSTIINQDGENVNAAKAGEVSQFPVPVTLFYAMPDYEIGVDSDGKCFIDFEPSRTWVRTTGNVGYTVSNGGSAGGITRQPDGSYEGFVRTGLTPGVNQVGLEVTDLLRVVPRVDRDSCMEYTEDLTEDFSLDLFDVFGLNPQILEVLPDPVLLTDDGISASPVLTSYQVDPAAYNAISVEVDLLEDGDPLGFVVGDSRSGAGGAILSRGVEFDIEKTYEAEVVVNRGSVVEVR